MSGKVTNVFLTLVVILLVGVIFAYRLMERTPDYRADVENVIIIVVDTLRYDRLGFNGYHVDTSPNLDALAKRSVVFDEAYTCRSNTYPSFTSIMTGLHVINHRVQENYHPWPDGLKSLTPIFKENGYDTYCHMAAGIMNGDYGFGQGVDTYTRPEGGGNWFDAEHMAQTAIEHLSNAEQPVWMMIHIWDPHGPYQPYEEAMELMGVPVEYENEAIDGSYEMSDRYNARHGMFTAEDIQRVSDLYDCEIRQMDLAMGDLFAFLENNGWFDNTVIVFTSDHGEAMGEDHKIGHGNDTEEQLHVPLLMHFPNDHGAGMRVGGLIDNMDITPTLLDLCGLPCPAVDGESLVNRIADPELPGRPILLSVDTHMYFSLWDGRWRRSIDREIELTQHELSPEEIEALRSLGYVGN